MVWAHGKDGSAELNEKDMVRGLQKRGHGMRDEVWLSIRKLDYFNI